MFTTGYEAFFRSNAGLSFVDHSLISREYKKCHIAVRYISYKIRNSRLEKEDPLPMTNIQNWKMKPFLAVTPDIIQPCPGSCKLTQD